MSLQTVLKIGKIYRNSTEYGLDEHRYINKSTVEIDNVKKNKDADKKPIETVTYKIPVRKNTEGVLEIFLTEKKVLTDEDAIKRLRNLNYKTSDKDKSKKYVFGDIVWSAIKKKNEISEGGNYRMAKGKDPSSFHRGKGEVSKMPLPIIGAFHKALEAKLEDVEKLMLSVPSIILNFDFEGQQWFELEGVVDAVNKKLIHEFIAETTLPDGRKVVALAKSLFKTIKPPLYDNTNGVFEAPDGVGASTPGFKNTDSYKVRTFESVDDVIDLFYGVKTAENKTIVRFKDIGVIALPNIADFDKHKEVEYNLLAKTLNNFFPSKGQISDEDYDETEIKLNLDLDEDYDEIFQGLIDNQLPEDNSFDIVFVTGGGLKPSVDLLEISNLKKSLLRNIHSNIRNQKIELEKQSNSELDLLKIKAKPAYNIRNSFQYLLDNRKKDQKKYQSHLLKVLPQIYSDTYYDDPILLPLFIEQVEYGIRNGGKSFNLLKYDFYFLTKIQKFDNMTSVLNSKSYHLGKALGTMSKPFAAWRDDCPIKSFEKSYVGNLSRRIMSTDEAISFANFLNEKLTIHERLYFDQREAFLEFTQTLREFGKEKYDRNACSLGFFESYFKPEPKKPKTDNPPIVTTEE